MKAHLKLLFFILIPSFSFAQEELTADELFLKARNTAFEQKDYNEAIRIAEQALIDSPNYTDISVFLGRLYTWNDQPEKAKALFAKMFEKKVENEDFHLAYASLEYWNDNYINAIEIVNQGLVYSPNSEDLLLLKAKIYFSNDQYKETESTLDELLTLNPKNTEARALAARLKEFTAKNAIGISYNHSYFDKQFDKDWNSLSLSYKRATKYGSLIFKANYANKFSDNGTQLEIEAYPKISKTFYLYVAAGFSGDVGIFPKYRTGASLYANLPKSFEAEVGYRQLYFSNNIWMYTASVGKYYKNYWFNLKTYITPDQKNISHSYTATIRYYTKGADDYFALQFGTGISPEEDRSNLLEYQQFKLKTYKIGADYNFSISKTNKFSISATYFNQEYRPKTKGNQIDFSLGYSKTF